MSKVNDQILGSSSDGLVAISPQSVLRVPTGLIIDGQAVTPHLVEIVSNCPFLQVLEKNVAGFFDVFNPTLDEVTFSWVAVHLHSETQDPIYNKADTSFVSPTPPPVLCQVPFGPI